MSRRRRLPPHGRRRIARACEASSSSISRAVPKIGRSRGQRVSRIRPLEIGSFSTPPPPRGSQIPNTERPRQRGPPQPAAAAAARQATCQRTLGAPAAGCRRGGLYCIRHSSIAGRGEGGDKALQTPPRVLKTKTTRSRVRAGPRSPCGRRVFSRAPFPARCRQYGLGGRPQRSVVATCPR